MTAPKDENCGNDSKNRLTSKNPRSPHPIFYIDQKHIRFGNFLDTLWVRILLKRGST